MSVSNNFSYLLVSIRLLWRNRITIIFTVNCKINNSAFTITDNFEGQYNWKIINHAIGLCNYIYIYVYFTGCVWVQGYLLKDFVKHNQHKFQHPTTFGWRDIEFRIWCLLILTGAGDIKNLWAGSMATPSLLRVFLVDIHATIQEIRPNAS